MTNWRRKIKWPCKNKCRFISRKFRLRWVCLNTSRRRINKRLTAKTKLLKSLSKNSKLKSMKIRSQMIRKPLIKWRRTTRWLYKNKCRCINKKFRRKWVLTMSIIMGFLLKNNSVNWYFKYSAYARFGNPNMWYMNIFQFWNFDSTL